MADDDLLNPDEIEALLNAANAGEAPPAPSSSSDTPSKPEASSKSGSEILDAAEIEAMMQAANAGNQAPAGKPAPPPATQQPTAPPLAATSQTEQLLNQAEADLAAAIAPDLGGRGGSRQDTSGATPFQFNALGLGNIDPSRRLELQSLQEVELDLRIELGRTELLIEEVVSLRAGSVVPLDKLAGDPVDILANGQLVARGEVLVLNDNFCVRIAEILDPQA